MLRTHEPEISEAAGIPEEVCTRLHRDLARIHAWLGNRKAILAALRRGPLPVGRVLDVGCGAGAMLLAVRQAMGAEVIGVDLRRPQHPAPGVSVIETDAVREPLPKCDVAISLLLAHHLSEDDVVALIRNVGLSARRFVLLDLVRHALPLHLFRAIRPFVSAITFKDGLTSVRRSFTARELRELAARALAGTSGSVAQSVAPFYTRQILDIRYEQRGAPATNALTANSTRSRSRFRVQQAKSVRD